MDVHNGKQGAGPLAIVGAGEKSDGGIYYAKGPEFHLKFMAGFVMPFRREMMQMIVASRIQAGDFAEGLGSAAAQEFVSECYVLADAVVLAERKTLDARMGEYWDLYMEQGKSTDDVMAAVAEMHQDFSR